MLVKEEEDGMKFMMENFDKAFGQCPKLFIVEKSSPLKAAIQKFYNGIKVLYCYQHYQRCIRHYFANVKESQKKYLLKGNNQLDPLPMIDELKEFESRINNIKANQEAIANNCDKLNQLMEKIMNERNYWSRTVHLGYFTA
jgi:hypothetical protein